MAEVSTARPILFVILDIAILGHRPSGLIEFALDRLDKASDEAGAGYQDPLLSARATLGRIRAVGNTLLWRYCNDGKDEDWTRDAGAFLSTCGEIFDTFYDGCANRELDRVVYEWALVSCIDAEDVRQHHTETHERYLKEWGSYVAYAQIRVARAKYDLLMGRGTPRLYYEFKEMAYRLAYDHGSLYCIGTPKRSSWQVQRQLGAVYLA